MISKFLKVGFLVLSVVAFVGCGGDDDGGIEEAPQVKFRAQVNGESFRTDNADGVMSNEGRLLIISGTNDIGQKITLRLGTTDVEGAVIAPGTFEIDENNTASMTFVSGGVSSSSIAETGGSIVIASLNEAEKTLFGSFSGTVSSVEGGDFTITAGALFNVSYVEQ